MNTYSVILASVVLAASSLSTHASSEAGEGATLHDGTQLLGRFSQGLIEDWGIHRFNGKTKYAIVRDHGRQVLHAQCDDSASGLVKKQQISLQDTPVLSWSWRVREVYQDIDETRKEGDDYPAGLYVAVKTGLTMLSAKVIHYVWSSSQPQGTSWDSAFTGKVKQVAIRSGLNDQSGQWHMEKRNLVADFKKYFGLDIKKIDSISLMTDCDNTDGQGEAWYGDIRLVPDSESLITMDKSVPH